MKAPIITIAMFLAIGTQIALAEGEDTNATKRTTTSAVIENSILKMEDEVFRAADSLLRSKEHSSEERRQEEAISQAFEMELISTQAGKVAESLLLMSDEKNCE